VLFALWPSGGVDAGGEFLCRANRAIELSECTLQLSRLEGCVRACCDGSQLDANRCQHVDQLDYPTSERRIVISVGFRHSYHSAVHFAGDRTLTVLPAWKD
jgi:hypothetical protein